MKLVASIIISKILDFIIIMKLTLHTRKVDMKKIILICIFMLGLGLVLYPIISNMFATTAYQARIKSYDEIIEKMDKDSLDKEKNKVKKHNEDLASSDLNVIDPFSESSSDQDVKKTNYYDALNIGPIIGSVEVPKININIPIYHGTSEKVLSKGAGHLENSSLPSTELGTHCVITAHRGLPTSKLFRNLNDVEIGDEFYVKVLDDVIAYKVDSIKKVLPSETDWVTMEKNLNKMTLLTCDPYMINTHRLLVTGHRIPYVAPKEVEKSNNIIYYVIGAVLLLVILLIIYRKKKKSATQ